MAENREGRLARWSRLKAQGKSDNLDYVEAEQAEDISVDQAGLKVPDGQLDAAALPGGVQKREFVPPMRPLASLDIAEQDVPPYEAPPQEALAMLNGEMAALADAEAHDIFAEEGIAERELTPEENEAVRDLPQLESLNKDSDFTPFLADNIPEFIRNRALRILWRSNPFFGFQDGLDDYAENFRVIDKVINAATDSIYRPGKGYHFPEEDVDEEQDDGHGGKSPDGGPDEGSEKIERSHGPGKRVVDKTEVDGQVLPNKPDSGKKET